jgi:methane/ammonia monooxygenase subunit B
VNEELVVRGRFRVFDDWPEDILGKPDLVYLNVGIPGPVLIREATTLNGQSLVTSTGLEIGGDYEFEMVFRGRAPGSYHVHPMINVYGSGPIVGPGKWVTVEEGGTFTNPATTLTGREIDLEHFGLGGVIRWHAFWLVIAGFWLFWWVRRPLFIPRFLMVQRGAEPQLVSDRDRLVAVVLGSVTLAAVLLGNYWARTAVPITIPLQAAKHTVKPLPRPAEAPVTVELEKAGYRVPGRTVELRVRVTNRGDAPIRVAEFTTANVRFLNAAVATPAPGDPEDLIAASGLDVVPDGPIAPGETRTIELSATDPVWETERLALLIHDPDNRFGGLLFFDADDGRRHLATIGGPMLPSFELREAALPRPEPAALASR